MQIIEIIEKMIQIEIIQYIIIALSILGIMKLIKYLMIRR